MGGVEGAHRGAVDLHHLPIDGGEADEFSGFGVLLHHAVVEVLQLFVEVRLAVPLEPDAEQSEHHRARLGGLGRGFY